MAAAASAAGSAMAADLSPVERRLKQLERLLLTSGEDGAVTTAATSSSSSSSTSTITISVETLLDALLVLYDECFTSALRREKTVSDFLELSTSIFIFGLIHSLLLLCLLFLPLVNDDVKFQPLHT